MSPFTYLLVGLGNPGPRYVNTRHNIGFQVIDTLARSLPACLFQNKLQALVADTSIDTHRVLLVKPQTFMNRSGQSVSEIASFFKVAPQNIIVIIDDLDLPVASLRIRKCGGPGGHNGVQSIIEQLGTESFPRIRIGIGREGDASSHVLSEFNKPERELIEGVIERAVSAIKCLVTEGIDRAMNTYNRKEDNREP